MKLFPNATPILHLRSCIPSNDRFFVPKIPLPRITITAVRGGKIVKQEIHRANILTQSKRSSSTKSPSVRTRPSDRKSWSPLAREANKTRKQLIKPRNKRNELTEADTCRSFIIFFKLVMPLINEHRNIRVITYSQKGKFDPKDFPDFRS